MSLPISERGSVVGTGADGRTCSLLMSKLTRASHLDPTKQEHMQIKCSARKVQATFSCLKIRVHLAFGCAAKISDVPGLSNNDDMQHVKMNCARDYCSISNSLSVGQ